ncbi:MAG: hypothetical protein ACK42H_13440 [Planctomycetota bacterium]|jgi:hypothetical protein
MSQSSADLGLTNAESLQDDDLDCSSIQLDQPDRLSALNARYDEVLIQIEALDLRIERLLGEISGEKGAKVVSPSVPG